MMIPKGRGIPHELKVGKSGYNDRDDVMRNKAHRAMDGDLKQVSKPYSPESASSPGNSKLIQGYAKGGHVKKGHRIPTDMHIPTQPRVAWPRRHPLLALKEMVVSCKATTVLIMVDPVMKWLLKVQKDRTYDMADYLVTKGIMNICCMRA